MKSRYSKNEPLLEVLHPKIGVKYHLSWASRGCVWILREIKDNWVLLETPKSKKMIWSKKENLRHLRKVQNNLKEEGKI